MDGYNSLVAAIVERACIDYIASLKYLATHTLPNTRRERCIYYRHERTVNDCEKFFRGQWIEELGDYNGLDIMKKCREKAEVITCMERIDMV